MKRVVTVIARLFAISLLWGILLAGKSAVAQSNYFVGETSPASWIVATNWSLGLPTANQDVFITNGAVVFVPPSQSGVASNLNLMCGNLYLNVGSTLTLGGYAIVGSDTNFHSNVAAVSGAWYVGGALVLGGGSLSNRLNVISGATLLTHGAYVGIALGHENNALVTEGASWTNNGFLYVGGLAGGNVAEIRGNLQMDGGGSNGLYVGSLGISNRLVLAGAGSVLTGLTNIYIGDRGDGNTLIISNNVSAQTAGTLAVGIEGSKNSFVLGNGATLLTHGAHIGLINGHENNALATEGASWTNNGFLYVGAGAGGNVAEIRGNLQMDGGGSHGLYVGSLGISNRLVLAGAGSVLTGLTNIYVGDRGDGNTLIISNNVSAQTAGTLAVGIEGSKNSFVLGNGASLLTHGAYIGFDDGNENNLLLTEGASWTNHGSLHVGAAAGGNVVEIRGNLQMDGGGSSPLWVGVLGISNRLVLAGAGSVLTGLSNIYVGVYGQGNALVISNNVSVQTDGILSVGTMYGQNSFVLGDGASLLTHGAQVGIGNSHENNLLVTEGASWTNYGSLHVGGLAGGNVVEIRGNFQMDGGGSSPLWVGVLGVSNRLVLAGAGSVLTGLTNIYVGGGGNGNTLVISNGTTISSGDGLIGSSGANNRMLIEGTGTTWQIAGQLAVGPQNATNNGLTIANNACVSAISAQIGGTNSAADNFVEIRGGTLSVSDQLDVQNGGLYLAGGTVTVGTLFATNNTTDRIGSVVELDSGTLVTTNGAAIVIPTNQSFWVGGSTGNTAAWTINGGSNYLIQADGGAGNTLLGALTGATGILTVNGGTLHFNNGQLNVGTIGTGQFNLNGGLVYLNALNIGTNGTARLGGTGRLILASPTIQDNGTLSFHFTANTILPYSVEGTGVLIQMGTGNLIITNANTYSGGTLITNGAALYITSGNNLGSGAVHMFDGATLGFLTSRTFSNNVVLHEDPTFYVSNGVTVIETGVISGTGDLVKAGGGTLTLVASNTYSGGTYNNAGWLVVATNSALGTGSLTMNGGTLSSSGTITLANPVYLANHGTLDTSGGNLTLTGPVTGANLWKLGTNTLTLSGNTNIYQTTYLVDATLAVANRSVTINQQYMFLGYFTNNTAAVVKDPGSYWEIRGGLYIGYYGHSNSLTVTNGGRLNTPGAAVGCNGNGNIALISGSNSLWQLDDVLFVGWGGSTNRVLVTNGGAITSRVSYIGGVGSHNEVTISDTNSVWNNSSLLYIGRFNGSDFNSLIITNGGAVLAGDSFVGSDNGNNNTALVSGPGSLWNNTGNLMVGNGATNNLLLINNSGLVSNQTGLVGSYGNLNTAMVTGAGSTWINRGDLLVGDNGHQNTLTVAAGAYLQDQNGYVGAINADNNRALITGAGSRWVNYGDLFVGYDPSSNNSLVISNGGVVIATNTWLGYDAGSTNNSITVTDPGSLLRDYGDLTVGVTGSYNWVSILNQGAISNNNAFIGRETASVGNRALVDNALWNNTSNLYVGFAGVSNSLTIRNGGTVSDLNAYIGFDYGAYSNSAVVNAGTWNNSNAFVVGYRGSFNTIVVSNGGVVRDTWGYIGIHSGSNSATVSGGTWHNSQDLMIGFYGGSGYNSLTITNGGVVTDVNGVVGENGSNNTVLVTGAGSSWTNSGNLYVGLNSAFNSLTIRNGGYVQDANGFVGYSNANNNTVLVTDAGSRWVNTANLNIGTNGNHNSLNIYNGGVVNALNGYVGNGTNANFNRVVVNGTGSSWNNASSLFIGRFGNSNSLEVSSAGQVNSTYGYVGWSGTSNSALVTGTGSLWNNISNLEVGEYGFYNTLTIQAGGTISNANGRIGYYGIANSVWVTDTNSLWNNSANLLIGEHGYYNSLTVTNGGVVRSANGYVGYNSGNNNRVLVTGTGSVWANSQDLYIGNGSSYNLLSVLDGGLVSNQNGYIGYSDMPFSYNTGVVNNATWINTGDLSVGYYDDHNALIVTNGGKLYSVSGFVGDGGSNNTAQLTGTGSVWSNNAHLIIGYDGGAHNTLSVRDGAQAHSLNGYVGWNGNDNTALITGTGSLWNNAADLFVGFNGGSYNTLRIETNGTVATRNLYVGDSDTAGNLVTVLGGNLVVTNPAGGLVQLDHGSLYFDTGNILLNHMRVNANGDYTDTGSGLLTLVNSNPTIGIAGGKVIAIHSIIAGSQGMIKDGAGELILTAANIYTGPTFVNNGTLTVMNSRGVGFGNLNILNGTLRTGSENTANPLELQINNSYTQAASGTLELGIGGTDTITNDRLNIGGQASLNGTLRVFQFGTSTPALFDESVLLVANDGVTGTFSNFVNDIPTSPMVSSLLVYGANDVILRWEQMSFTPWAITPNQLAVAAALDSARTNPAMTALFTRLDYPNWPNIPTTNELAQTLPRDFDLIAPEELTALFSLPFAAMDMRGYGFLARVQELRAGNRGFSAARLSLFDSNGPGNSRQPVRQNSLMIGASGADILRPAPDNPWGLYLEGNGEYADVDSDVNASGYHLRSAGVTIGLDRRLGQQWAVGLTLGYAYDHAGLINDGSVNVDAARGSLYAVWFNKGWHIEAMALGGLNYYKTKRAAIDGVARGDTDGYEYGGLLGGGYDWQKGFWFFGPQVTLQYKGVHIDSFKENGSLSPLDILSQSQESLFTRVGAHIGCRATPGKESKIIIAPDLSLAWQHEYLDNTLAIDSRFASGAGNIFTVHGPDVGRDSLVIGAGIWIQWSPTVGTYLNYTTQLLRDGYEPHNLNVGIQIQF